MRTPLVTLAALLGVGVATWLAPVPAHAQVQDQVVTVYGTDPCPSNNGQEIVVCKRAPESERFRIPKSLRDSEPTPQTLGGGALSAVNTTGGTGAQVQSCNAIGAGVNAGCFQKEADAWKAQKRAEAKAEAGVP